MTNRALITWGLAVLLVSARARAQDTWQTPYPGIRHLVRKKTHPNGKTFEVQAVFVDLCEPANRVRVSDEADSKHYRVVDYAKNVGAAIAINGDFYPNYGMTITEGVEWQQSQAPQGSSTYRPFLACSADMRCAIYEKWPVDTPLDESWHSAVSGTPVLVREGKAAVVCDGAPKCETLCARTAYGVSQDGLTLILVVVEGGTSTSPSPGMNREELAKLMVELGAFAAVNMDGSGSSVLAMRDPQSGVVEQLSSPPPGTRYPFNILTVFVDPSSPGISLQSEKAALCGLVAPSTAEDAGASGQDGSEELEPGQRDAGATASQAEPSPPPGRRSLSGSAGCSMADRGRSGDRRWPWWLGTLVAGTWRSRRSRRPSRRSRGGRYCSGRLTLSVGHHHLPVHSMTSVVVLSEGLPRSEVVCSTAVMVTLGGRMPKRPLGSLLTV